MDVCERVFFIYFSTAFRVLHLVHDHHSNSNVITYTIGNLEQNLAESTLTDVCGLCFVVRKNVLVLGNSIFAVFFFSGCKQYLLL